MHSTKHLLMFLFGIVIVLALVSFAYSLGIQGPFLLDDFSSVVVLTLGLDKGEANQLINADLRVGHIITKVTLAVHMLVLDLVFLLWSEAEVGVFVIVGMHHRSSYDLIGIVSPTCSAIPTNLPSFSFGEG